MNMEIIYFTISYLAVIVIFYLLMNFLSNGFFSQFIRVKLSRGSLTLVEIKGLSNTYYRPGKVSEEWITFKNRNKDQKKIKVTKNSIERVMGLDRVTVMEVSNQVLSHSNDLSDGFDPVKFDHLLQRALMKPTIKNPKDLMKAILLIMVLGGVLLYLVYQIYELRDIVTAILKIITDINKVGVI